MSTNALDGFIQKKKDESPYLTLADGETIRVLRLNDIKIVSKTGFGGQEKEVVRFVVEINGNNGEVYTKNFDNGTGRFAEEVKKAGITIGSSFDLKREGLVMKTKYFISNVKNPSAQATLEPQAPTPAS